MSSRFSRRDFLKSGAVAASLAAVNVSVPAYSQDKAPSDKLNIAFVGTAGMRGADHFKAINEAGENIVAICDVDSNLLNDAGKKFAPKAEKFMDFRKM
ncbi:MAG: twin-arginine translocation signal domain-containing protein, partial [Thermoguttaceae bacterium]|nr:twin-arginine translocation signal domain-containing protein [Thermoguttaceae bacterium]